jgi:hypothetical protein
MPMGSAGRFFPDVRRCEASGAAGPQDADEFMKIRTYILGGIALGILIGWGWPLHLLALRESPNGRWVLAKVVCPGDAFVLGYTHSVIQKPVRDFYMIDEHYQIIQNKTIFPGTGFGLPSEAHGDETYTLLSDGSECISGMQRRIPSLLLRVERAYNNTFTFKEAQSLNLSQILGDGLMEIRIHCSNPIQYTLQVLNSYGER